MGLKKFVKKIGKVVKKVAPVALGAAGMYYGGSALGSMLGGVTDGGATSTQPSNATDLGRVDVNGSRPSWLSQNAGSLVSGGLSLLGGYQANQANAKQAQQQMDFQREMSGTSYQRGVSDMQAAGLNPMLAYSQGGASSPGGASASIQDAVTPALNSGRSAAMMKASLDNMGLQNDNLEKQNDLIAAQTANTDADTKGKNMVPAEIQARIAQLVLQGKLTMQQARQIETMMPFNIANLQEQTRGEKAKADTLHMLSTPARVVNDILDKLPGVGGIQSNAKAILDERNGKYGPPAPSAWERFKYRHLKRGNSSDTSTPYP